MDYLPVSLKKGRPFLQSICERGTRCRAICPKRELLAFVDQHGYIRIHMLSADERHVIIQSQNFLEFLWVAPCLTNKESTFDRRDKEKRWLLAVTSSLDLVWYAVGKAEEGSNQTQLLLERVSEIRRMEFSHALRNMDYNTVDAISSLKLLGTHSGEVLVCVNDSIVCRLGLDNEFHCIRAQSCLPLETSLLDLEDHTLPEQLEGPIDFCFRNPLLFLLYRGGFIMIYNVEASLCVGVLSIKHYCDLDGGKHPESEALLHEAMTSQFLCLAISSDFNKLVVGTALGHLVLINLTEYFAEFPAHYSPHFLKSHLDRQAASSRGKARLVRPAAIIMEEVEDRVRYTGLTQPEGSCPCICIPCHPVYSGYRSWTQRLATLGRNVNSFQPSSGGYLNLSRDFELKVGGGRIGGGGVTHSHCWYKEPIVSHVYYPGFKKPSVVIGEATQVVGGGGPPLERVLTDRYVNRCILPSATPTMGVVCRVSYIEVMSLMVVAYYVAVDGSHAGEGNPLVGLAEYKIDQQTYSATRLPHASWLVRPSDPEQPIYLATDACLSLVTFFLSQEEFVDKVLTYSSARVAEDLCQLNRWDRYQCPGDGPGPQIAGLLPEEPRDCKQNTSVRDCEGTVAMKTKDILIQQLEERLQVTMKELAETEEKLRKEENLSLQCKVERDQTRREHQLTKVELQQATKQHHLTMKKLAETEAILSREENLSQQCKVERDQTRREHQQTKMELQQAMKQQGLIQEEYDQARRELETLRDEHSKCRTIWIVPRHQVTVLDTPLGGGAWGFVREGSFKGQRVAVKCIYESIITQHTIKRVYREICTMAQVHHPNLVQFIAAVLDDQGGPMIITELLDTTLRKAYEDSLLKPGLDQCVDILCDVASALNYLHELPEPIIHRDVSSNNVLLKAMAQDKWAAKLSDFGSANWTKLASTVGEGAIVYTAPEAFPLHPSLHHTPPPQQTTKIDVYSYGILLCEVVLRRFPDPAHLQESQEELKAKHVHLHSVMVRCTHVDPAQRPSMADVLNDLGDKRR